MGRRFILIKISLLSVLLVSAAFFAPYVFSADIEELRQTIDKKTDEIKKLEEEARQYRQEIASKQQVGKTLKEELARIDRTVKQLQKDISVTQAKIQKAGLEIQELDIEIKEKEASVARLRSGLAGVVRAFAEEEQEPLVVTLVKSRVLSDFLQQFDYLALAKEKMLASVGSLRELRIDLENQKARAEKKKDEAEDLKKILAGRRTIVTGERAQRDKLLKETKNQERAYQNLLREKEDRIEDLEREIRSIEQEIKVTIDPSSLPAKGIGVLGWPLPELTLKSCWNGGGNDANCVTQFFGYTSFARAGGYGKQGHNGMDFRASIGTPVFASENGVVAGVGDTDVGCRGASYGKWVLIKHPNNLSTLYAHLSQTNVSEGQEVKREERIGLSGKTGYATGPHLHFTVFAAQAVEIKTIKSKVCGRNMTLPFAGSDPASGIQGYLDPLDYL